MVDKCNTVGECYTKAIQDLNKARDELNKAKENAYCLHEQTKEKSEDAYAEINSLLEQMKEDLKLGNQMKDKLNAYAVVLDYFAGIRQLEQNFDPQQAEIILAERFKVGVAPHNRPYSHEVLSGDFYIESVHVGSEERMDIIIHKKGGVSLVATGGNVGIGTTAPKYKLDVKGQVRADNVTVKSDARYKQNIQPLASSLSKLAQLRGVSFNWKDDQQDNQIGLVAQEVEKILPEIVSTDSEGYKSIAYGKLTAVLLEAIKEQQQQIDKLTSRLNQNSQN